MALATGLLVLVATAASAAAPPADGRRCIARAGEVVLQQATAATVDAIQYNGAEGMPRRGGKTLPLCRNVAYRIAPIAKPKCIVRLPAGGSSAAAFARQVEAMARARGCPVPRVIISTTAPDAAQPVVQVVPSGEVDLRYRREIAVFMGPHLPPPPVCANPPCDAPAAPVLIPDLVGRTIAQARSSVQELRFSDIMVSVDGRLIVAPEADDRIVSAQSPAAGTAVSQGERIILVAQPATAPVQPAGGTLPVAVGGFLAGAAGTEVLRRLSRRRPTGTRPRAAPPSAPPQGWLVRARPDLPGTRDGADAAP